MIPTLATLVRTPPRPIASVSTALALGALLLAPPLAAQGNAFPTTPEFVAIIRLAQEGRSDSARGLIEERLKAMAPTDSLYPEGLYTEATVASSGSQARLLFSRVAVEYPRSDWADKALLRLAQLDYGSGDQQATITRIERLMTNYPNSEVLSDAALWGARAALESNQLARACGWLDRGLAHVGSNVELRNQIEFTRRRCSGNAANAPTPAPPTPLHTPEKRPIDTPPVVNPTPPPAAAPVDSTPQPEVTTAGQWRVQVAAISDPVAISRMVKAIRSQGFTAYESPGPGGLTRVQAGPFNSREEAQAQVEKLAKLVGGRPYVTKAAGRP